MSLSWTSTSRISATGEWVDVGWVKVFAPALLRLPEMGLQPADVCLLLHLVGLMAKRGPTIRPFSNIEAAQQIRVDATTVSKSLARLKKCDLVRCGGVGARRWIEVSPHVAWRGTASSRREDRAGWRPPVHLSGGPR